MTTFINPNGAATRKVAPPDRSAHVTASTSVRPATRLTYSLVLGSRDQVSVSIGDSAGSIRIVLDRPDLNRLIEVLVTASAELLELRGDFS